MAKLLTVRKEGQSKVMAVTKFMPKDWLLVTFTVIKNGRNSVTVRFNKVK